MPLTEEQHQEICRRYLEGEPSTRLAPIFGVSDTWILKVLAMYDVPRRPSNNVPKRSKAEEIAICERYKAGESAKRLSQDIRCHVSSIADMLRRQGYQARSLSSIHRKHTINESYFATIDSEEKAYWLGFLAADGCVRQPQINASPDVFCSLQRSDEEHLVALRKTLGSTHSIGRYDDGRGHLYSRFTVRSRKLAAGLAKFGITPAKTWTLKWPGLPDEMLPHFLRGYVDGDGGFYAYQRAQNWALSTWLQFRLAGNEAFLLGCQQYLIDSLQLNRTKLYSYKDSNVKTLVYGGRKQVSRVYHLLYDGAGVCLVRKRDKVASLML